MRVSRIASIAALAAALTACGGETETAAPAKTTAAPAEAPAAAAPESTGAPASEESAPTMYVDHADDAIESEIALTKDMMEEFKAEGLDTSYLEVQLERLQGQL